MSRVEEATRAYWEVSLAYHNRREGKNINVHQAIGTINVQLRNLGEHRSIAWRLIDLGNQLIYGGRKRAKAK